MKRFPWLRNRFGSNGRRVRRRSAARRRSVSPAIEFLEDRCLLATFTVTSLGDDGADGTLRNTIANVNNNPGADLIVFDPSLMGRTIPLVSSLPFINESLEIRGPGSSFFGLTIDGQNIPGVRPITITPTAQVVTISNLTVTGGNVLETTGADGGGIGNNGPNTTLNRVRVTGNHAHDNGGGIVNNGNMTINDSLVSNNDAGKGSNELESNGGGIANGGGVLTINSTCVKGNWAENDGGGISNRGTLTVDKSDIEFNTAELRGGGIFSIGPLVVNETSIQTNLLLGSGAFPDPEGGGIFSSGNATINLSNVNSNQITGFGEGAGIAQRDAGRLTVQFSNISVNMGGPAVSLRGSEVISVIRNTDVSGNASIGIRSASATLTVDSSTVWGHLRGVGIELFSTTAKIINTTIAYNLTTNSNTGAGIVYFSGTLAVINSTIVGNTNVFDTSPIRSRQSASIVETQTRGS